VSPIQVGALGRRNARGRHIGEQYHLVIAQLVGIFARFACACGSSRYSA
jgi:hypothetical protein